MKFTNWTKVFFLFLGDVVALYASLAITLLIRYGSGFAEQFTNVHAFPFTIVFVLWIVVFYVAGLYDLRRLRNNIDFLKTLLLATTISAMMAIILFYLVPAFGIAPKTNLLIFAIIFIVLESLWRHGMNTVLDSGEAANRIVLVGDGAIADEIAATIEKNSQLGYAVLQRFRAVDAYRDPDAVSRAVAERHANVIAVPRHLKKEDSFALMLYDLFGKGILVMDVAELYEQILRKVPLADIEETWFLENIEGAGKYYDSLKRAGEVVFAVIFGIILIPFDIIIAFLVKISSPGPVIYRQTRIGQNGRPFILYKFRTMRPAEKNGWLDTDKARITAIGRFLRRTHLDELPQIFNLLRGDVSLVGPRPDFIEFYRELEKTVPYYAIRTIVKPGITGWAQVVFPITESAEQAKERLCYDIYYLKNRSLVLDTLIILRTFKTVATAAGR
jgi:exopolysaccharide biosynthesis polyprenyl glycosylphosphotransferase